jgi:K+-transporting ATPase A subunit
MLVLWLAASFVAMIYESQGNNKLTTYGVSQTATSTQPGGNMEGKETRPVHRRPACSAPPRVRRPGP